MGVRIDEARCHDQARCIDDALGTCLREIANAGNPVVHDTDVGFVPGRACAINDAPVLDQQVKRFLSCSIKG